MVSYFVFCVFPLCYCLVVSTSAIDCLANLVSEMTCYVSSGTLNPIHLLASFVTGCSNTSWTLSVPAHTHMLQLTTTMQPPAQCCCWVFICYVSMWQDIALTPQPSDALPHCQYYLTLTTPDSAPRPLQVKVGDCVYVTREGAEPLSDELVAHPSSAGDRLDIFRVERLWIKFKYVSSCLLNITLIEWYLQTSLQIRWESGIGRRIEWRYRVGQKNRTVFGSLLLPYMLT